MYGLPRCSSSGPPVLGPFTVLRGMLRLMRKKKVLHMCKTRLTTCCIDAGNPLSLPFQPICFVSEGIQLYIQLYTVVIMTEVDAYLSRTELLICNSIDMESCRHGIAE